MIRSLAAALLSSTALVAIPAMAQDAPVLPSGGSVVAGSASITQSGAAMEIRQGSRAAIVNWSDFSIGKGGRVDIVQPDAGAALLNRVTSLTPSTIAGTLNANGQVYLVNPNGIAITAGGIVNAGAFVASTLDISNDDFMAGNREFVVTARRGAVSNAGTINILRGGYAALLGGQVRNDGLIAVTLGKVGLASGDRIALDVAGDGFLRVGLGAGSVDMAGRIAAQGSTVVLSAGTAREAARGVVNLSGTIEARSVGGTNGNVVLTGTDIALSGAGIDASGNDGGMIRIGGDYQGGGTLERASTLSVDAASTIRADGNTGRGGNIVLWSDDKTSFTGTISARGVTQGGDAEVSGKALLDYRGTADLTGASFGNLLLDPYNLTISSGADSNVTGTTATNDDSVLNVATLTSALANANVTVSTGASGGQTGTLTVSDAISWSSGAMLSLTSAGAMTINAPVSAAAGGLTLLSGGAITTGSAGSVAVARFTLGGGAWGQVSGSNPAFSTADFRINGGTFRRASGGDGTSATPWLLTDVYGLQGVGTSGYYKLANDIDASGTAMWNAGAGFAPIGGGTAISTSLDGAGYSVNKLTILRTSSDNQGLVGYLGAGGTIANIGVSGSVTGRNNVGGLVGRSEGTISGASADVAVSGNFVTGGMVGFMTIGSITGSYATGAVTNRGNGSAGGLVGRTYGGAVVQRSYATGNVSGGGGSAIGGLIGDTIGATTITQAYATGNVSGANFYGGGLVGYLEASSGDASISYAYATGSVSGTSSIGGLVGLVSRAGTVNQAWSSGLVTGTSNVGGFIGFVMDGQAGPVTNSFWDRESSGQANGAGGGTNSATGLTTAQARSAAAYAGFNFTADWLQSYDLRPILRAEAATAVGGVIPISNLHQLQLMEGNLTANYKLTRDIDASLTSGSASGIWSTKGFGPIAQVSVLSGTLDGDGRVVRNINVARPTENYIGGLVNYLAAAGTVKNIGVTGSVTGNQFVGGLIGGSEGTVTNSFADVTVTAQRRAGGLVGDMIKGVVQDSHASGTVKSGTTGVAGGLIGNLTAGTVTRSYATGNVDGNGKPWSGGLIGQVLGGAISQVYATGNVSGGTEQAGGLIGRLAGATLSQAYATGSVAGSTLGIGGLVGVITGATASISQSWSSGAVSGTTSTGGLVGLIDATVVAGGLAGNYWDTETSGMSVGFGAGSTTGITGLTTAQARDAASYAGWNFSTNWWSGGDTRPMGRWEASTTITNLHQLQLMALNLSADYKLANDIDATATKGLTTSGIWSTAGFVPVGSNPSFFTGNFDGGGHSVANLSIDRPSVGYIGLFGGVFDPGTVSRLANVNLTDVSYAGAYNVGGLVGYGLATSIANVSVSGTISGIEGVGLLAGVLSAQNQPVSVTGSSSSGTVSGKAQVGGLVGHSGTPISLSYSSATVIGTGFASDSYLGGLVGLLFSTTASQSYATGSVTALGSDVGGLVGATNGGAITDSFATGDVAGGARVGGLIGSAAFATIARAYAAGTSSESGFVGQLQSSSITNSFWNRSNTVSDTSGATGLTLAQMQDVAAYAANFAGFDFSSIWTVPSTAAYSSDNKAHYPELRAFANVATVTAGSTTYQYGDTPGAPTGLAQYGGLATGDYITTLGTSIASPAAATSTAGRSYRFVYVPGAVTVTPRAITITPTAISRLYGDSNPTSTTSGWTIGGAGLASGDSISSLNLSSTAGQFSNVASYDLTGSNATGTGINSTNYAITYATAAGGLEVARRPITVVPTAFSQVYGTSYTSGAGFAISSGSVASGEAISGISSTTVATAASSVGSYDLVATALTGINTGNYAITFGTLANGLTVTRRAITVTADTLSRIYGNANPGLTYAVGGLGLVNGDAITGTLATSATGTSGIGAYAITQGSLAASTNYDLTYTGANLAVTPRAITVTADALSRIYGNANPGLTYAVGGLGLVNGDALTGALANSAVGTSGVGAYPITRGTLAASANYALTYTGANLSITPRAITVTADTLSRIYGNANPGLTYAVGGLGLVNGDAITGTLATTATGTSNIGAYAITQGTLAASTNYDLTYTGANLTVTPRAITVTADALSRIYGNANPALTYKIGGLGLVNGDALTGTLATSANATSGVGAYGVTQGSLAASGNYAVTYTGADLAVSPRAITVAADPLSRIYGNANPGLTYTVGGLGLVNGDSLSGALATNAVGTSGVGSYGITQGTLAASANYALSFTGASLVVGARSIAVTADALSRIYGNANPTLTYAVGGLGLVNGDALTGALATSAVGTSGVGAYGITQGSLAASANYALTYTGANLTIGARAITVTADALSRIYGNANPALTYTVGGLGLVNGDALTGALATSAVGTSGVGAYGITQGSLAASANYALTYAGANLTVTPRAISVAADAVSRIYGNANPALSYTVGGLGLVNGDALTGALATSAVGTSGIGAYGITQGTLAASANYALTYAGADLTVTPRAITVAADALSRVYGNANPALTYAIGGLGLVNGDTITGALSTGASATSNVGAYAITQGTLAASSNYALSYSGADLVIAARPISVTADAQSRVYGDANPLFTYKVGGLGLVNGDALSGALATSADTASGVGVYAVTRGSLNASSNYAVTYTGANLTIGARAISVTANALSRVYGDANPALAYTIGGLGLVNGDALSGALATAATGTSGVGAYAITQGSLASSSNYALTYVGAALTIGARAITVAANASSRAYGDANPALTYSVGGVGLVNGDALTGALSAAADASSGVGTYAIAQGTLAASSNYALTFAGANLTVTPRAITVTADALGRIYGNANPALSYTVGGLGLANGDALTGALATSAVGASGIGAYGITQGSLAASANYDLTYTGANLTIGARAITVAADALSRIYGNANPALTYTVGGLGLVNGDALTGALATSAVGTSGVGVYNITQGSLAASPNYALTYTGANLTVGTRAITVAADALSRIYGNANPALTYTVGGLGLVNGDVLTGMLATNAAEASGVGAYGIAQGTVAASPNYAMAYTGADLTIVPRAITVAADAQDRIYGNGNPALTYTVGGSGLVNGDALVGGLATTANMASNVGEYAITQGSLAASSNYALTYTGANLTIGARAITVAADALSRIYGNANAALTYTIGGLGLVNGDALTGTLATSAVGTSGVGVYGIAQGSLAASSNYALTYTGASLTVGSRAISVTADAQSRIYGNANPALTYTIGGLGLVNGDVLTGALTTNAVGTSGVGAYGITQGSLAASGNYALTYAGADLTIGVRPITVTADGQNRVYGNANPALTYTVGGLGLVNGDGLTGTLATPATAASNVGAYTIGRGSLAASSNYALTYTGANLVVVPRAISVSADALSRIYGSANATLTYAVGGLGLVNGDALTGALATSAVGTSGVGAYGITQGSLAASANYALTYTGANLTVTPRAIIVAADALSRTYGNANPALTYTIGGLGLVNGDALTGTLATSAIGTSGVGAYGIAQGSLAASANYALTYTGASLTVTPRAITVVADAVGRVYGNANPALTYTIGGLGLVNGDALTGALATSAVGASGVGVYGITQGTLTASANYALTYTGASLTVGSRAITVTADALSRVYGNANPALTYTIGGLGLVNGDTFGGTLSTAAIAASNVGAYAIGQGSLTAGANYALTYTGANLVVAPRPISIAAIGQSVVYGDAPGAFGYSVGGLGLVNGDALSGALSTVAVRGSGVGSYAIGQGTLAASGNYALTYTGANLTITPRPIIVTASGQTSVYGDPVAALGYTIGGSGLYGSDSLAGALAVPVTSISGVGSYAIARGTLGVSNGNYSITYNGANYVVTARPITVAADAQTRVVGTANPILTYRLASGTLVNGDVLSGALATSATASSPAGNYAITLGSLAATANYRLAFIDGQLAITGFVSASDALSRTPEGGEQIRDAGSAFTASGLSANAAGKSETGQGDSSSQAGDSGAEGTGQVIPGTAGDGNANGDGSLRICLDRQCSEGAVPSAPVDTSATEMPRRPLRWQRGSQVEVVA